MGTTVKFDDLALEHRPIEPELHDCLASVLANGRFVLGANVRAFEEEFAAFCGVRFAVGTSSGTSALFMALAACGIGPGDEVITAANSYVATAFAISYTGATPVLVDVDPATYNLDVAGVERALTARTRMVLPVHLYGLPVDMDPILELAKEKGLYVVEDAAQAHGARYKGRPVGSLGHIACFSFYPSKNLGAIGDGGAVVTDDPELAAKVRVLRYMGQKEKYTHLQLGYQERLDELQAAFLRVKLRRLGEAVAARRAAAARYDELLRAADVVTPRTFPWADHAYHLYVIRTRRRDELKQFLADRGVETQIHYPIPIPLQPCYRSLGYAPADHPVTTQLANEILSLPMRPSLTEEEIRTVSDLVSSFVPRR